ncbi:MAG: tetratricopeptide repeat protein [Deltaproteobacteria bacterium]
MPFITRSRRRRWAGLIVGFWVAAGLPAALAEEQEAAKPAPQAVGQQTLDCSSELAKLREEHQRLLIDYKNAVAQAKALLVYKNQARDIDDVRRQNKLQVLQTQRAKDDALAQVKELEGRIEGLNADVARLRQERDEYKNSFEKAAVENIIGEDAQKKITTLEAEKKELSGRVADLEKSVKVLEQEGLKKEAEAETLRRQTGEIKEKYAEARRANSILEEKLRREPKRAAELARENKILVKRTALMHYNLGVFYTQNREFERAVKEFEKAVELNPQDAASFFNLGYIYAEHLKDRPKAVENFRTYLKLAKKDDKDADWVKRYILTWQTWEGNVPIK